MDPSMDQIQREVKMLSIYLDLCTIGHSSNYLFIHSLNKKWRKKNEVCWRIWQQVLSCSFSKDLCRQGGVALISCQSLAYLARLIAWLVINLSWTTPGKRKGVCYQSLRSNYYSRNIPWNQLFGSKQGQPSWMIIKESSDLWFK